MGRPRRSTRPPKYLEDFELYKVQASKAEKGREMKMNHELTPEPMSAAGGGNGYIPVLDPPVALARKMVAQLPAADLSVPSSASQRPVSYRDVLLGQPPNDKSPQKFSAPSLMIRSGTKKYGCNIEIEGKGVDERQDQQEERKVE